MQTGLKYARIAVCNLVLASGMFISKFIVNISGGYDPLG
jgi:hypothetical protein